MKNVRFILVGLTLTLAACAQGPLKRDPKPDDVTGEVAAPEAEQTSDQLRPRPRPSDLNTSPTPAAPKPAQGAKTAEALDTTTKEQRAEAAKVEPTGGDKALGKTIASLGDPTEPGFWLKTPLVKKVAQGRVTYAGTGKSAQVELRPLDAPVGAGSRISLAALRLLGAPLTGLPELEVTQIE